MIFTPGETTQRHRYIEATVEATLAEIQDERIRRALGAKAIIFEHQLTTAVVANVRDGVISLPRDYDFDSCPLPIVTVTESESLMLSADFNTQTTAQTENTINLFKDWSLKEGSPEEFYEFFTAISANDDPTPLDGFWNPLTAGAIGCTASLLCAEDQRKWFTQAPRKGLTLFQQRPILLLLQKPAQLYEAPGVVAHELTHVNQVTRQPALSMHSQRSADMQILRTELEAYHDGFPFSAVKAHATAFEGLEDTPDFLQMAVEITRQNNVLDPADPFKPSGFMLKKLEEKGLSSILHGVPNFEALVELVGADAVAEE
ncbi:hypothetical protein BH09PAT4_BH09PAT4_00270 [soil metagenome]